MNYDEIKDLVITGKIPIDEIRRQLDMPSANEVYAKNFLAEYATVPLVMYIDGERKVIGEATVQGTRVRATIGNDAGAEVLDLIFGRPGEAMFSLGFSEGPNPYRDPAHRQPPSF